MLSSKYGFGQSMDCLGQSMDPYFEQAIHGLSKHKMTHRVVLEQASFPPTRDQVCPLARNECPFIIGARCRRFEEKDTTNFIF